jgi:hypothetical protein
MSGNIKHGTDDLFRNTGGVFGAEHHLGYHQVRPSDFVSSNTIADLTQVNADAVRDGSGALDEREDLGLGLGPSSETLPTESPPCINPALLSASRHETELSLDIYYRISRIAGPQTDLSTTKVPLPLDTLVDEGPGINASAPHADQPANSCVGYESLERELVYYPSSVLYRSPYEEAGIGPMGTQVENYPPTDSLNSWTDGRNTLETVPAHAQQQGHGLRERPPFCPAPYYLGTFNVLQQNHVRDNAVACDDASISDVRGFSNTFSDLQSAGPAPSDVETPSVRSGGKSGAEPSPVSCALCDRVLQDMAGLRYKFLTCMRVSPKADRTSFRHHLDTHDPEKTSKYKCDKASCLYASRYPKDVRRHKPVHEKTKIRRFVCDEPGCESKFPRKDNLLRHKRESHRKPRATSSASTTNTSRLNDEAALVTGQTLVPETLQRPKRSRATTLHTVPSRVSSASALNSSSTTPDTSSSLTTLPTALSPAHEWLDPCLRLSDSASGSF